MTGHEKLPPAVATPENGLVKHVLREAIADRSALIIAQDAHIKALETAMENSARSLAAEGRTVRKTRARVLELRRGLDVAPRSEVAS